jgi:tetratricopeptide (TPR) repeat protein/predicted Ser/Thr protein kinase
MGTGDRPARRSDAPLSRGELLGRYVVLEKLGQGAMGIVYKAFDPELDRAVALKLLIGEGSETGRARLTREAQAMARVSHPNVIAVHDVGTHEGRVFFAMELVDGLPLAEWRSAERPTVDAVLEVFRQAGAGIAAAHAAGIVHRDFKPDNVLVDVTGRVRVLDFGLARRGADEVADSDSADEGPIDLTRTGTVLGTPAYMAPEQFSGAAADARSDQFSFCVALHEALSGQRPFGGDDYASLSGAVVTGDRRETSFAGVPTSVVSAINRGLETKPADRFASMDALLEAIAPRTTPRWTRAAFAGVGILAVSMAAAYGLGRKSGAVQVQNPCEGATRPLETVWNEQRRLELTQAFAVSGAHNASSMSTRVTAAIDEHARRWAEAASESCRMVAVDHTLGEELSFRSSRCIASSLEHLGEQLDTMAEVDEAQVQSALTAIDRLDDPATCVDPRMLELQVLIPREPELRRRVEDLAPEFARVIAFHEEHQPDACIRGALELEPKVREVGHGPSLARVLDIRAGCLLATGKHEEARALREQTFEEALASGHDELAISVAADIGYVIATRTNDLDDAETWLRRADALARRHGLTNAKPNRSIFNAYGVLESRRGNMDASLAWLEKLVASADGRDPLAYVTAIENMGATQANGGSPEAALATFTRAQAFADEHWGPDHRVAADARTKSAQVLFILGRVEEARDTLRETVEVTAGVNTTGLGQAYALYSLSLMEALMNDSDAALRRARESYDLRKDNGALETADAYGLLNTLFELELQAGNLEDAETHARESLALMEEVGTPLEKAKPQLYLVRLHLARGDDANARAAMQRVEALLQNPGKSNRRAKRGPVFYRAASRTLELGNETRALELFAKAEAFTAEDGDDRRCNEVRLRYARTLFERGDRSAAGAVLERLEATVARYPYPPSVVEDARALREKFDATPTPAG